MFRGGMSFRELWVLINRLPQESWTQTILRDLPKDPLRAPSNGEHQFGPWALINYQIAALNDSTRGVHYAVSAANGGKPTPPEPTPVPGSVRASRERPPANPAVLEAILRKE